MRVSVLLLALSLLGALGGAWLIGYWAVGIVVVVYSAALGVYAVLRDTPDETPAPAAHTLEAVLDRARHSA